MFGFSRKTQTENPSEHLVKLASVSKDTISSKVSVFLKYRFFGLVPIFFAALLFVGCGGSGSSKSDYIVSFYDANLNLIESVGVEKGAVVELSTLAGNNHLLYWYKAGEENATLFGQYTPTGNINFYAVPNVVEVASEDQLYHIDDNHTTLSGNYILTKDITLTILNYPPNSPVGWTPIGQDSSYPFKGVFNGNGHTISGLWIDDDNRDNVGLFGRVNGGTIKNLNVVLGSKGIEGREYVGAIAGYAEDSIIDNVAVTGNVSGTHKHVGGIVGAVDDSNITNSHFTGSVSGIAEHTGGIVGNIYNGNIANSYSEASVSSEANFVGGIAGVAKGNITNSHSTGVVNGGIEYVGGIVGVINGSIIGSSSEGYISGLGEYIGGIAGQVNDGIINSSHSKGNVTGSGLVGGIAGQVYDDGIITDSFSEGNISGLYTNYTGGIAGLIGNKAIITNSYSKGNIDGAKDYTGGIAGGVSGGNITKSHSTGKVSGAGILVGGIAGDVADGNIVGSYSTGGVNGDGWIGGIAGAIARSNITNSYSKGNINGGGILVGGIVGLVEYGAIVKTYSTGSVNGNEYVGGIAGGVTDSSIANNAAINSNVTADSATTYVNRVIGAIDDVDPSIVSNNFARSILEPNSPAKEAGDGKDDGVFKLQETYNDDLGWNFTTTWTIAPNVNDGYPYLR